MSEKLTLQELKEKLRERGIEYKESDALTTLDAIVVTAGQTSVVDVRADATDAAKRRTIEKALRAIDSGKSAREGVVMIRRRRSKPKEEPKLRIKASTWRNRNRHPLQ